MVMLFLCSTEQSPHPETGGWIQQSGDENPCVHVAGNNNADPFDVFEDEVEFPPPAKSLLQLHDVVLLQRPKHLQLPKRRLLDLLIFCAEMKETEMMPLAGLSLPPRLRPSLTFAVFELLNGHQLVGFLRRQEDVCRVKKREIYLLDQQSGPEINKHYNHSK